MFPCGGLLICLLLEGHTRLADDNVCGQLDRTRRDFSPLPLAEFLSVADLGRSTPNVSAANTTLRLELVACGDSPLLCDARASHRVGMRMAKLSGIAIKTA